MTISSFIIGNPLFGGNLIGTRGRSFVIRDDFARESIGPTGFPTLYTNAETGAAGTSSIGQNINRVSLVTDSTGAGDDQDMRTSGLRIDRNYCSLVTGMQSFPDMATDTVQVDMPFSLSQTADTEAFIGIYTGVALTNLPTTVRHLGVYYDASAGANFMLSSANGTTQSTTDTTVAADTNVHILRVIWTAEDVATIRILTAAGAAEGVTKTVAALNGTAAQSYELHWFVQTETNAAKTLVLYPWRVAWS